MNLAERLRILLSGRVSGKIICLILRGNECLFFRIGTDNTPSFKKLFYLSHLRTVKRPLMNSKIIEPFSLMNHFLLINN